jgi:phage shock protein PspC (stress-responsive transcriptional regulator)
MHREVGVRMPDPVAPPPPSPWLYPLKGLPVKLIWLGCLLWAAGRWDWLWPWLFTGIFLLFDIGSALLLDPGLLAERASRHANTKRWDVPYVLFAAFLLPIATGVVAGLDERFGWGPDIGVGAQWVFTGVAALGFALTLWAMWANAYFSAVVRIQEW